MVLDILMVEDDLGDVDLVRECLEDGKIVVRMEAVHDGLEALDYLYQRGRYSTAVRPDIIILDLNLPKKNGKEVLSEIKKDENLKSIPVIMLSSSDIDEDILATYREGCSCYITKPVGFDKFAEVIQHISEFWFKVAKLPSR